MDRGVTLAHLAWGRAGGRPNAVAYVHVRDGDEDEQELSWLELDRRARVIAGRLQHVARAGHQELAGSRALLLFSHGLEFPAALLGCFYARVVAVPTNPPTPRRPLERTAAIARDAALSFVLTTKALADEREDIVRRAPELGRVPWIAVDALAAEEELPREGLCLPRPDDLAFLQYTSGSTGTPRGVMVSHANALHNVERLRLTLHVEADSVVVSWLPFHHDMGLVGILLSTLYRGPRCVLLSPAHFLEKPLRWLEAVTRHRGTMTGAPDFAFELCARRVQAEPRLLADLELSSLARCFSGSEPIRAETLERFARAFAPAGLRADALVPGYGLAEATLAVSASTVAGVPRVFALERRALDAGRAVPLDAGAAPPTAARRLVGCGAPIPGVAVAIVDPATHRRLPDGNVGEVWVSGPSNALGYWQNPEATRATFAARIEGEPEAGAAWLRTGDLGLMLEGELCLCGRLKDLVIVRGENHYPQDIERAAGDAHDALRPGGGAAFAAEAGAEGDAAERLVLVHELRRPRGVDHAAVCAAVARAVTEAEGVELDAIVLIPPGELPKTTSGKVRRRRTRRSWEEGSLAVLATWERPRASEALAAAAGTLAPEPEAVTRWLAERVGALRGAPLDASDRRRPLGGLGLDSLGVTQLFHALSDALGAAPPLARLFEGASLAEIAVEACAARRTRAAAEPRAAAAARPLDPGALSHGQRALWFLQRLAPRDPAYHLATALAVLSPTRPDELRRALETLVRRHAALRTTFHEDQRGEPRRRVHDDLPLDFRVVDARALDEDALRAAAADAARQPFDLEHGPLLRVRWFEREAEPDVCALAAHHIALDHWSFATLFEELALLHDGRTLAPLAADWDAFLAEQQACQAEGRWDAAWEHWRAKLRTPPEPLELGGGTAGGARDERAPDTGRSGESSVLRLDRRLGEELRAFAAARGLTPSVVALAAFEALLARLSGSEDFLLATLHAGRSDARFASLVGYLVNTLVLRADLSGAPSFERLLERTRADLAASLAHAELPFAHLVERLHPERAADGTTLVRALFTWQNPLSRGGADLSSFALGVDGERVGLGGLVVRPLALELGSAQFDLSLTMGLAAGAPVIALEVDRRLLGDGAARRLARAYEHLLRGALAHPGRRLRDHALVGTDERARLLALAAGPAPAATPWPAASVGARFLAAARAHAGRPALLAQGSGGELGDEPWSFDDLARRVARVARALARRGVGPGGWVGLELPRSRAQAVALLATLCRGAAWLPIDPALPERRRAALRGRVALVLDAAAVHALLAAGGTGGQDREPPAGAEALARELAAPAPLDPAYALFTSGSSGEPKGVVVPQRALGVHVAAAAAHFELTPHDRVLHMAAIGFDLSIEELLPALLQGASVVVREPAAPPSIDELEELVQTHAVGVLDLPTVYWHEWMRVVEDERRALPAGLRLVIVGGERASSRALATWRRVAPAELRWVNTYGPTEATVTATLFDAREPHQGAIPIGRPVAGQRVLVLDAEGQPVAPGAPGELAIGGACLANGYLGLPARTAASFVPDPLPDPGEPGARVYLTGDLVRFDDEGRLLFLGRRDAQVKIRGVRVEPGEVEAALAAHPAVAEACVLACADQDGARRLAGWYVPLEELAPEGLRDFLAERLPAAFVPAVLLARDALPRNAHGKLDRSALLGELAALEREGLGSRTLTPQASDGDPGAADDASALAGRLAAQWSALLQRPVARHDDFFALGGDSIQSIQAAARAAREGIVFTPADLFRHPTPAALARVARRQRVAPAQAVAPHVGPLPLSPIQRWFFGLGLAEPAHWNFSIAFELEQVPEPERLAATLVALARRHEALRLRFRRDPAADEGWSAFLIEPDAAAFPLEPCTAATAAEEAALVAARQASLDLEREPCAALLVRRAGCARLVLLVHHLLVDAVSWRVLGEELALLLRDADPGPPPLPWHRCVASAGSAAAVASDAALQAWLARFAPVEPLPRDDEGPATAGGQPDAGCVGSEATLATVLAPERRRALQELALRSRVTLEELLASALCGALAEWSGARTLALVLEGHGRDGARSPDGDPSRTVGWFTELTPLVVEASPDDDPLALLRRVKQELAALPGGRGAWFRARHGPHAARRAALALPREPEVCLNLLGELDGLARAEGLALVTPPPALQRSPRDRRTHLFEVDAWLLAGALHLRWSYAAERHDRATVEGLLAATSGWLTRLVEAGDPAAALRGADFPHAGLDDLDLGKVLTQLRPTP